MARPVWSGNISFGLIHIPVALHTAERRTDIQFHLLDSRDQARVRYERINEETGAEVPWDEIVKGYEYDDGRYVLLNDEDFKRAAPELTNTIELSGFVEFAVVEPPYFERPYYLVPDGRGEKPYVLLRESLRRAGKLGIATTVIRTRQYLAAVYPRGDALMLNLLRYHQELRDPKEFKLPGSSLSALKIGTKEIDMAKQLIDSLSEEWQPERYHDEYRAALRAFIDQKIKSPRRPSGRQAARPAAGESAQIVDLTELLKRSLTTRKSTKKPSTARRKSH